MKIIIDEGEQYDQTEVIIHCKKCDEEVLLLLSKLKLQEQKIIGMQGEVAIVIEPKEIFYFESVDKKTFIYTQSQVYESPLKLYEIERLLKIYGFFRATKSTIVNINKIQSIKPKYNSVLLLEMENGEKLTVSRQYAPILKQRLGGNDYE